MSWLSKAVKKVNKVVAKVDPITKNNPDFVAVSKAFEAGNWDKPFSSEANAWDYLGAAGPGQLTHKGKTIAGALDPEKPKDRAIGRTVGTVIADFWTFGAFSALAPKPETGMQLANEFARSGGTASALDVKPRQGPQLALASVASNPWAIAAGALLVVFFWKRGKR